MHSEVGDLSSKYRHIEKREPHIYKTPLNRPGDLDLNVMIQPSDFKVKSRYDPKTFSLIPADEMVEEEVEVISEE